MIRILRRRGLGNTSTKAIKNYSKHNIEIIRNDKPIPNNTDLLIRWGCRSHFPSKKCLNKSQEIGMINNKYLSRKTMQDAGVSVPKLLTNENKNNINFPVIIRAHFHSQGKKLWFANHLQEVRDIIFHNFGVVKNYYISEYIKKDVEYGIFIFNNRIWSVIAKVPKTEEDKEIVAWNVAQGTHKFVNVRWSEWPINACIEALKANRCFDIDFSRVDVISKDGKPYVLELNSAHSLTSPYRQETFTKCLDYYIKNGPVKNELNLNEIKSFKSIIHPALRENNQEKNL